MRQTFAAALLAAAGCAWVLPAGDALAAQQASSIFTIAVNYQPAQAAAKGVCKSTAGGSAFGALQTVICTTGVIDRDPGGPQGTPASGAAFRYLTRIQAEDATTTIDSYTAASNSTEFQVMEANGYKYVQMTVGW